MWWDKTLAGFARVLQILCFQAGPVFGHLRPQTEPEESLIPQASPLWLCPQCAGPMILIQRLTATQFLLPSPPSFRQNRRMKLQSQSLLTRGLAPAAVIVRPSSPQTRRRVQPRRKVLLPPRTMFRPIYPAFDLSSASNCSRSLSHSSTPIEFA